MPRFEYFAEQALTIGVVGHNKATVVCCPVISLVFCGRKGPGLVETFDLVVDMGLYAHHWVRFEKLRYFQMRALLISRRAAVFRPAKGPISTQDERSCRQLGLVESLVQGLGRISRQDRRHVESRLEEHLLAVNVYFLLIKGLELTLEVLDAR